MVRPTLQTGDTWDDALANASGYPISDGQDLYGHGPKIIDDWLNDAPDQIKARFYDWYNRIQLAIAANRILTYTGATIVLANGSRVALAAGQITLPANATVYVYVSGTGVIAQASALPSSGILLGLAVTDANAIASLVDLRSQVVEQVRSLSAENAAGYEIGDVKWTCRQTPSTGWVRCDFSLYEQTTYPLAYDAIGRVWSLPTDPVNTFRVPPPGRCPLGSGTGAGLTARSLGQTGGAESVSLSVPQTARHTHPTIDSGHIHNVNDDGHAHGVSDAGHGHPVLGSFETSDGNVDSIIVEDAAIAGETNGPFGYTTETNSNKGSKLVLPQKANIAINGNRVNITIQPAQSSAAIQPTGEGLPHENMMPYAVFNEFIRLF